MLFAADACTEVHTLNLKSLASFPRPRPAFYCLHYILPVTEWEQDYWFSTQCESESCLSISQLRSDLQNIFFCCGDVPSVCAWPLHTLCYMQSAITTSQRVCVATIKILVAKNCRTWDLVPTNRFKSNLLASKNFPGVDTTCSMYVNFGHIIFKYLYGLASAPMKQ